MESVTRRDFVRNSMAAGAAVATAATSAGASQAAAPSEETIKILAISCGLRKGKTTTPLGVCLQAAREVVQN
jgi:hypothetical protein